MDRFDTCEVTVSIEADTNVSIHKDYNVTNWSFEDNMLRFTITNLSVTAKKEQLPIAEYNACELTDLRAIPIVLAANGESQSITQAVPRNANIFLWDRLSPIVAIPVTFQTCMNRSFCCKKESGK